MFNQIPDVNAYLDAPWSAYAPFADALKAQPLTAETVQDWLAGWTWVDNLVGEVYARLIVAYTINTQDAAAEARYEAFVSNVLPELMSAAQDLKVKLLDSGLEPAQFELPLKGMRIEAALFREANLPLLSKVQLVASEYEKIVGAQTIEWEGEEKTLAQLGVVYEAADRPTRQRIWEMVSERWQADRQTINDIWQELFQIRQMIAANAGEPDYRTYRWKELKRFDYTPADCETFHAAIESVVVPVATRLYAKQAARLGVEALRPWDVDLNQGVYTFTVPALKPYDNLDLLAPQTAAIFNRVDPQLGAYFATMQQEGLLDLNNRKGKSPGAYCISYPVAERPFIFANAVGLHDDVQTLLHEAGHAFHVFETNPLPYSPLKEVPMEFAEVASMSMELLGARYLPVSAGGFYSERDAARAISDHLIRNIQFWPYMAMVDAFQHWAYTHSDAALDPAQCDAQWDALWRRFIPGMDTRGADAYRQTGWHRKGHIFGTPFYYVEYGLAQMGAFQVWRNALKDPQAAVASYRKALALGGTVSLPQLFDTAGARFAFDAGTLGELMALVEEKLVELEQMAAA